MNENINRKPSNFDWVTARSGCSIKQMFEELRLGIKQDVETINEAAEDNSQSSIQIAENARQIKVFVSDPFADGPSVLFVLMGNVITVADGETSQGIFSISITLNDEGECRFVVGGKELDSWQVRRKALEGMFFRS